MNKMNQKKKCKWQCEHEKLGFVCESSKNDFDGLCSPECCFESIFAQIKIFGFKRVFSYRWYGFTEYLKNRLHLSDSNIGDY
jgi:hypothetical protein